MHMQKMNVTPEMAQEWLETANVRNRSMSPHTVLRYAADMLAGYWQDTHQNAIAFYDDGSLADGQHRLAAVVKAKTTVQMYVAFGLQKDAIVAIDQGRPRKMADVMAMSGVLDGGKYPSATVAMMNVIRRAEGYTTGVPTAHEMTVAIERMRDGINFSHAALSNSRGRIMHAAVRAAIATAFFHCDHVRLGQFAEILCDGMPKSPADATVITLRNRILLGPTIGAQASRVDAYKMAMRFIKAYANGKILTMAKGGAELVYRTGAFDVK
jgi:hypothetical protein